MVHEIPATPIGVCGRHRCFPVVTLVGANKGLLLYRFTLSYKRMYNINVSTSTRQTRRSTRRENKMLSLIRPEEDWTHNTKWVLMAHCEGLETIFVSFFKASTFSNGSIENREESLVPKYSKPIRSLLCSGYSLHCI